jgi:hypothetical protein
MESWRRMVWPNKIYNNRYFLPVTIIFLFWMFTLKFQVELILIITVVISNLFQVELFGSFVVNFVLFLVHLYPLYIPFNFRFNMVHASITMGPCLLSWFLIVSGLQKKLDFAVAWGKPFSLSCGYQPTGSCAWRCCHRIIYLRVASVMK